MASRKVIGVAVALFGLAGAAAADPLGAAPGAPGRVGRTKVLVSVSARGLDLASPHGAELFLRRLDLAVARACDERPSGMPLMTGRSSGFDACRREAFDLAMTYAPWPQVRQRYAEARSRRGLSLARR